MKRSRVSDLAAEFGTTAEAILRLLQSQGFPVRSTSSRVDAFAAEWLRFEFTVDQPSPEPSTLRPAGPPILRSVSPSLRPSARPWRSRSLSTWQDLQLGFGPDSYREALHSRGRDTVLKRTRRSIRSLPLFGSRASDVSSLDLESVEKGLRGSPYSLPGEQHDYLRTTFLPRVAALSIRARREAERITTARQSTLRRITRSSEIYESNKIEGLGPDLATTDSVLSSYRLHQAADVSIAQGAIQQCLSAEPKVRDVVGLGAARQLAEIFCSDQRPLTESDIRQLHELIMVDDPQRGSYKRYVNSIAGSDHIPIAPSDTPAAMQELVGWLATTQLSTLWRAAAAHAWLTHVHPFHDGNGRIARLLANLVLIRAGMPPLIVSATGDRGAYIDALAESDQGGNILPLANVFRRVISRAVQDMTNPALADEIFNAEIAQRSAPHHVRWNTTLNEFLSELAPRLLLHRLHLYAIGEVSEAELARFAQGYAENVWIAKVAAGSGARDLLLHVALPSRLNRTSADTAVTPSIFVSVRNDRPLDARQYLPVGQAAFTYEFTPLVEDHLVLVRHGSERKWLPVHGAADAAAEHLARAHRQLIGRAL